jgi:hypothetical protein
MRALSADYAAVTGRAKNHVKSDTKLALKVLFLLFTALGNGIFKLKLN